MKKVLVVIIALFCSLNVLAQAENQQEIKDVIENAYIKGVWQEYDVNKVKAGFHPEFKMIINKGNGVGYLTLDEWCGFVAKNKEKSPEGNKQDVKYDISVLDEAGKAATARIKLFIDGKHVYTDYMSLYRFEDGWKIISKIYEKHA